MSNASAVRSVITRVAGMTVLIAAGVFVDLAAAQGTTMFPTPNNRYYNPYRFGAYGTSSQGVGGAFSAGSPNMFNQGPTLPAANAYDPNQWPNLYTNKPYGGQFHFRPMVGPAYDPFRNGR